MLKRSNIVFICLIGLFFLCVMLSLFISLLSRDSSATTSYLEDRAYTQIPISDRKSLFFSGDLQTAIEGYLSDHIPYRDDVILCNAAAQRVVIRTANLPIGYEAYPTFFSSDRILSSKTGSIYRLPASSSSYTREMVEYAANRIVRIVDKYPNIDWTFYLVDNTDVTSANPSRTLMANTVGYGDLLDILRNPLEEVGCTVIDGGYENESDYLASFFHTDHHMQMPGAVRMYGDIMIALGNEPINFDKYKVVYSGPFYGSDARVGLDIDFSDEVLDVDYSPSDLAVSVDGVAKSLGELDDGWGDSGEYDKPSRFANVYGQWFHGDYNVITIENRDVDENKELLLISDSYDNSTSRLYAESYKRVYEVSCKSGIDIDAFIKSHPDITDAAFILGPQYLDRLLVS